MERDADGARILRSVLMKPEHEPHVPWLHERVSALAAADAHHEPVLERGERLGRSPRSARAGARPRCRPLRVVVLADRGEPGRGGGGMSSKPTTDTAPPAASRTPRASTSLVARIAVGGSLPAEQLLRGGAARGAELPAHSSTGTSGQRNPGGSSAAP